MATLDSTDVTDDNFISFGLPDGLNALQSMQLPPEISQFIGVTKALSLEPLPKQIPPNSMNQFGTESSPMISKLASAMIPVTTEKIPIVVEGEVHILEMEEIIDLVQAELGEESTFDDDEQAMEALKEYHRNAMIEVEQSPKLKNSIMLSAKQQFNSLNIGNDDNESENESESENTFLSQSGGGDFAEWEEQMMRCGFESTIVATLTYMWVPEWIAKQIAWYTAAFFRGIAGVTWGVIKSIFGFVWDNKIGLVLYMLAFSNIMSILKPAVQGPTMDGYTLLRHKWSNQSSVMTAEAFNEIGEYNSLGNMTSSDIANAMGHKYGEEMFKVTSQVLKQGITTTSQFASTVQPIMYDVAKRTDWNMGISPETEIPILEKVVESYNYFLSGYVSDYIGYVHNGIKNAIMMWKYGIIFPGISKTQAYIPDRFIPDIIHKGNLNMFNTISLQSLVMYLKFGMFIIKTGGYAIDLGGRLWNEVSAVQYTCAQGKKISNKFKTRMKQNIQQHLTESRFMKT